MTRRLVVDASAAIHVTLGTEHALALVEVLEEASLVVAPDLFHSEVANSLWKYVSAKELTLEESIERFEEAVALVDVFYPTSGLAVQALAEAARQGHPVYDLLYATLARVQGCATLTMDSRFAALLGKMEMDVHCPLLDQSRRKD